MHWHANLLLGRLCDLLTLRTPLPTVIHAVCWVKGRGHRPFRYTIVISRSITSFISAVGSPRKLPTLRTIPGPAGTKMMPEQGPLSL
jgi:hypothetical protein